MFSSNDLGRSLFNTWNEDQQREEVAKLVEGYRNGLPLGILFKMAETISGSEEKAREYLMEMLTLEERKQAVAKEAGGMKSMAESYLL